jgi:hypothetical protein
LLESIETTQLGLWLRESPSVWAFPMVLTLHTVGLAVLIGASWVLDLRLLGIGRHVPLSAFRWVFPTVAVGLVVNLLTGVLLFIKNASTWGVALPFFVKMALVVASVATLLPIRSIVMRSNDEQLDAGGNARMLAVASILAWSAAVTAGRLLAYTVV